MIKQNSNFKLYRTKTTRLCLNKIVILNYIEQKLCDYV